MSSPLGGLYISSLNRGKQSKFDLARRGRIGLDLTLVSVDNEHGEIEIVAESRHFHVGEVQTFTSASASINIESGFLESQELSSHRSRLLSLKCQINVALNGKKFKGLQEVNLSPNEPVTCLVNGNEQLKITMAAKPA